MQAALLLSVVLEMLVGELGNRRFDHREAAHERLRWAGEVATVPLERGAAGADAERSARCRGLLAELAVKHADEWSRHLLPKGRSKHPWLHVEGYHSDVVHCYLHQACGKGWEQGDGSRTHDYPLHREACRLWVRDQLQRSRSKADILKELEQMVEYENSYKQSGD